MAARLTSEKTLHVIRAGYINTVNIIRPWVWAYSAWKINIGRGGLNSSHTIENACSCFLNESGSRIEWCGMRLEPYDHQSIRSQVGSTGLGLRAGAFTRPA